MFDQIVDELIDDYVAGELSQTDRDMAESHFLITLERQEKLAVARALNSYVQKNRKPLPSPVTPVSPKRVPTYMWAISAMLFLALGAVVVWSILRPRPTQTIALNLNISTSERGNASKPDRITINSDVAQLRLSLRLPENEVKAAGYRVALVNPDGSTQDISIDKVFENVVVVNIDATKLTSNTYALQLSAIDENKNERRINGSYFFEVVKS